MRSGKKKKKKKFMIDMKVGISDCRPEILGLYVCTFV